MWLIVALGCAGCGSQKPPELPPPKVTVVHPVAREIVEWDEYTARLEAVESVEVRPRVGGYLQSIHFQDGAIVHEGDLLFTIDPRPYQAELRRAAAEVELRRSQLALAQKNFQRGQDLLAKNAISKEEVDVRQSNLRQAQASLDEALAQLDAAALNVEFTQVTAPVTGRIGRRLVTEGNLITGGMGTQGTLLTTIVSMDPIYAYFDADEGSMLKYMRLAQSGERPSSREHKNPVQVGLADEEGFPHAGTMDFVDNQVDLGTGTIVGRALLPNPDLILVPGMFARLRLQGSGRYRAILIPDEAILNDQAKKFVYVVDEAGTVHYRAIEPGPLHDGLRVVREGLSVEDWVVTAGMQRIKQETKVEAQRASIPP